MQPGLAPLRLMIPSLSSRPRCCLSASASVFPSFSSAHQSPSHFYPPIPFLLSLHVLTTLTSFPVLSWIFLPLLLSLNCFISYSVELCHSIHPSQLPHFCHFQSNHLHFLHSLYLSSVYRCRSDHNLVYFTLYLKLILQSPRTSNTFFKSFRHDLTL